VVERWNQSCACGRALSSPTIRAAIIAGMPWSDVHYPGCRTSRAIDIQTIGRHPLASVRQSRAQAAVQDAREEGARWWPVFPLLEEERPSAIVHREV
jgi:hypothetical protein